MTLQEVIDEVKKNLGRDDADTQALVIAHTNKVLEFLSTLELPELETSVDITLQAGVWEYPAPADVQRVYTNQLVDGTSVYTLEGVTQLKFSAEYMPTIYKSSSRRPYVYTLWGSQFRVYPRPDKQYTWKVLYYKRHPAVSQGSDQILVNKVASNLVALVTGWCWLSFEELPLAQAWFQMGMSSLSMVKAGEKELFEILPKVKNGEGVKTDYWADPFVRR